MEKRILPEEKLLRLIRGKKKEKGPAPLKARLFPAPDMRKLLLAALVLSSAYLALSLAWPLLFKKEIKLSHLMKGGGVTKVKEEPKLEPKPYSFYQEQITGHNIFTPSSGQAIPAAAIAAPDTGGLKDLKLLGIISGDNPQAIIEDKKAQKTYFLKQNEFIGEFQVEAIGEGKVTLNFRGQRFNLFL